MDTNFVGERQTEPTNQTRQQPQQCKKKVTKQRIQKKTPFPDTDDIENDSNSNPSRLSGRSKKQTQSYGSPIRHAVKEISQGQITGPSPNTPPNVGNVSGGIFHLFHQLRKESGGYLKNRLKRIRRIAKIQLKT